MLPELRYTLAKGRREWGGRVCAAPEIRVLPSSQELPFLPARGSLWVSQTESLWSSNQTLYGPVNHVSHDFIQPLMGPKESAGV